MVIYWSTNVVGYALASVTNLSVQAWSPINGRYILSGNYFEHWEARDSFLSEKYFRLYGPAVIVLSQTPF